MLSQITVTTLLTGISGFTLVFAIYEFATGHIPGDPVQRGLWGYRWMKTLARQRLVVILGFLVIVGFLVIKRPFSPVNLIAGGIGALLAAFIVISDARSRS